VGCGREAAAVVALAGESAGEDSCRGDVATVEFALPTTGFDFFARVDDPDFVGFAVLVVGAVLVEVLELAVVGSTAPTCGTVDGSD
jgi:hypothetical protein